VIEKLPLFALSAASSVVTLIAQKKVGALGMVEDYPFGTRVTNAVLAYAGYLSKTIWPRGLACFYPYVRRPSGWHVVAAVIVLLAVSFLVIRMRRKRGYLAMGWLWYLVTLVPVIGLVQVGAQSMADRYTYVPLIGVFVMVAWGVPELAARFSASRALPVAAGVVALALAASAFHQVGYWRNDELMWQRAIDVTDGNYMAENGLGLALRDQGEADQAIAHLEESVRISPRYAEAHNNLGTVLGQQGRYAEAIREYMKALEIKPDYTFARSNLGNVYFKQGRYDKAISCYRRALKINPNYAEAQSNLGSALFRQGHYEQAIAELSRAIRLQPDNAQTHLNLAIAFCARGDYARAWDEVRLCRQYGGSPSPELIQALSQKMPR
jgi:tetratricopeptide (TPR) repeat protein